MRKLTSGLARIGEAAVLAGQIVRVLPRPRLYFNSALQQAYVMGIQSLPLVLIMAFLGGAVTSQQTGAQFAGGLPLWVIGSVLAASVITELGPVLTGIVMMATWGCSMRAAAIASRSKRATTSGFSVMVRCNTFNATIFFMCTCSARYTAPMPPVPRTASNR
jgi:ABC-type transporter Mla maintaining outer membrane lipid asymmetry permease subunit MlaE